MSTDVPARLSRRAGGGSTGRHRRGAPRGLTRRARQAVSGYGFAFPALLLFGLFAVYPMLRVLFLSFFDYDLLSAPEFVGLDNYRFLLEDQRFHGIVGNSIFYLLGTYVPTLLLALALALALNTRMRGSAVLRLAYFLPVAMSWVVTAVIWRLIYHPDGLMNQLLGLDVSWLTSSTAAPYALVIMAIWKETGFFLIIFLAGLQSIDSTLYEAARVDGAGPYGQFRHVTLPLLRPVSAVACVLAIYRGGQVFDPQYVMTGGGPGSATEVINLYIYRTAFVNARMGRASAVAVVLFIVLVVAGLLLVRGVGGRTDD